MPLLCIFPSGMFLVEILPGAVKKKSIEWQKRRGNSLKAEAVVFYSLIITVYLLSLAQAHKQREGITYDCELRWGSIIKRHLRSY